MDQHFQISTPIDRLDLRTVGVSDVTYGVSIWDPSNAAALLQGEWLQPGATYETLARFGTPATKMVVGTHGGVFMPALDPRGSYDQQALPGITKGASVVWAGNTFEVYTDRIATAATPGNLTIGVPVGLSTDTLNIAGGAGAASSRMYLLDSPTWGTDMVVGWVIRPYSATTGYVGVLMNIGSN